MSKIPSSEITKESVYNARRTFLGAGAATLALPAAAGWFDWFGDSDSPQFAPDVVEPIVDEGPLVPSSYETITNYNNYYEFGFGKDDPAKASEQMSLSPWSIEVGGVGADNPMVYDIADLRQYSIENHVRRFRCVEGWSMVIPWNGIKLSDVIKAAQPNSKARYVYFETVQDDAMPRKDWAGGPYIEGLAMDEAMNDLTMLATGIYDKDLLQQNGAPVRLVVPWKYGFKYAKSIVKIHLVDKMPRNTWWRQNSREYGFYANVHPDYNHPRWSQATERVIGSRGRRKTERYNGYAEEVQHMYNEDDRTYFY